MEDQSIILVYLMTSFKRQLEEVKQELINENVEINEDLFKFVSLLLRSKQMFDLYIYPIRKV